MKKLLLILIICVVSFSYAQEDKWGITAFGGTALPTGSFSDFYNAGYTFSGGLIYDFKFSTRIAVTLGYTKWELNSIKLNDEYIKQGGVGTLNAEAPVRTIPLLLQVKWYGSQGGIKAYALIEGGFYFTKSEFSGTVTNDDSTIARVSKSESINNTGVNLGLGVSINLTRQIEIDVAGKYHIVSITNNYNFTPVNYTNTLSTDQYWSFTAGINIILIE